MNISDINPAGRNEANRTQAAESRRTVQTGTKPAPAPDEVETPRTAEPATRDAYLDSAGRQKIADLAALAEKTGGEPREEAVQQARARVASGYYQSEDVLGRLAVRLIGSDSIA